MAIGLGVARRAGALSHFCMNTDGLDDEEPMMRSGAVGLIAMLILSGCGEAADDGGLDGSGGEDFGTGGAGSATGGAASGGANASGGTSSSGGASSGGSANGGAASGGTSSGGTSSGGGDGSGGDGSGTCEVGTPPEAMQETLDLTWDEMTGVFQGLTGARPVSASIATFRNTILDQIMEGDGTLNYCVRYESNDVVSAALRAKIEAALRRAVNKWIAKIAGYDCFPYDEVDVRVSGWATWDRDTLDWDDDDVPIYVGQNDGEGAPRCPSSCSRFDHREEGYTYPSCPGGFDNHFDLSLWLTDDFGYVGGDWGQRLDRDYFVNSVDADNQHIFLHEVGHGFGFPDYYNWSVWAPGVPAPACVMNAGAASQITDWDGWMFRRTWSELKSRWL